ncbi:MAG: S-layer homology domain-containing protein [Flavonifractor plautii]|nr:S-layer homology domain-containing protein [Flavonifractor plautii]MDY3699761.1 S-layer homology domain-containing protein [Flavonifractor plautii]
MEKKRFLAGSVSIALAVTMFSTTAFAASVKFTDVPDSHWASSSITEMADKGIMSGIGNNLFAPSQQLSNAEFVTMLVRQFYSDKLGTEGSTWYAPFMAAAKSANILTGTNVGSNENLATSTINRYDMAQLMYNVLKAQGIATSSLSDTSKVADWSAVPSNYCDAVSVCYNMGMLTGVDNKGTFNGTGVMDRAQAAVVMDRLLEVCSGGTPSTPVAPEKPAGSLTLTNDNILHLIGDGSKYENGVFHLYNSGFEGSGGYIQFINNGYSTLTFTVTAHAQQMVVVGGNDSVDGDIRLMEEVGANEVKTFYVDVSGVKHVTISIFDGRTCDAEVTNIYLS